LSSDYDIVIVGGGAAGMGAARRLAASGRSVLLLEAGAHLGGRALTCHLRGLHLDVGCGWLHSADRNAWATAARDSGILIDDRKPAWGAQFKDLGFTPKEQAEAHEAFSNWMRRMKANPPRSDCAGDALEADSRWSGHIRAIAGFISGAPLESLSIADYLAYDENSTEENWRVPIGYGSLIARALPESVRVRFETPVLSVELDGEGVRLGTPAGHVRARAAIITVSTHVLAGDSIKLPAGTEAWRASATSLPLGRNEKLFLEILGDTPFEDETQVLGNPRDAGTGAYYIRPMGLPVIECFYGADAAALVERDGPAAGFAFAQEQLAGLFGDRVRGMLKPLLASNWGRMDHIGGAYSYARPGHAAAREMLARPFENRIFFAGEATSSTKFSTAHGAHDSGVRAANEALAAL
jgi:monoamine oxidase